MQEYFDYSGFEEISPEIIEKKQIRRKASACGIGLLALFGIMYFWSFVYLRIAIIFGLPVKSAINLVTEPFISQIFGIAISAVMIILPFLIVTKSMGLRISTDIPFKKPERGYFLPFVMLGVGFCLFSSFATNYGSQVFTFFGIEFPSSSEQLPQGIFGFLAVALSTAFFPAFFEELVMRGMVMGILRKNGDAFAIITSAFVFGIMHANVDQIVFAFFVGIILGFITVKSGSIWPAIAVHFINNLISVAFSYMKGIDSLLTSLLLIAVFAVAAVLSVFGFISLQKSDSNFSLLKDSVEVSAVTKIKWFLTSPIIIISAIVSLVIAFFVR